jgi:hypothetical protein
LALAFAVETHTYITARRVRAAWQDKQREALRVNLAVLAGLLAFSSWNQLNYLSLTWTPPYTALALPGWLAYVVRALVVPCAFMAAAFLAPLAQPISAQIETEARATLADVFRIARKQRRRMLKQAEADGRDMTGALVELVTDEELRRVISHAYGAIAPAGSPLAGGITRGSAASSGESPPTHAQEGAGAPSQPTRPGPRVAARQRHCRPAQRPRAHPKTHGGAFTRCPPLPGGAGLRSPPTRARARPRRVA